MLRRLIKTKMAPLTIDTKIKLPSGYEIPQLGFGVSTSRLAF